MTAEAEPSHNVTKTFRYSFPTCTNEDILFKLEVPVEIPHDGSARELVQRVLNMFRIPVYLEEELNERLAHFVSEETKKFHNDRDEKLLNQLKNSELNVEGIVKNWEKLFKDNVMEFAEQKGTSDEEVFAAAYHKLVHSPALETILQVEDSYAATFSEMRRNRDEDIKQLTIKQTEEMEEAISQLNITTTEEDINALAASQFEAQALAAGRWGSQLDALWQTQRAQFRGWLMTTLHDYQTTATAPLNTPSNSPLATFGGAGAGGAAGAVPRAPAPARLEDSFTIHLGSQLKQTHNIRIFAADPVELCAESGGCRLQTALSLYSGEVAGVVLAASGPPARLAPPVAHLAAAAAARTDHHFPHVESQLRALHLAQPAPQAGDVFLTTHSNLPDAHVVFHLVVEDSNHRSGEITSRHPAILGLRNILKAASCNDVTTIVLPLLLRHELTEEMTVSWTCRRAELVLKCVKGFMLECAGWGGAELRTLCVCVPARTPPHVFAPLAAMLPALFRVPTPLKITNRPA